MASRALARFALIALLAALAFAGGARAEPLTVMTFNVWYGGVQVDSDQIGRAIRAADADIVGVQEPEGHLRQIARSAGMPYVDESLHLISRYPLFAARAGGVRIAYAATDLDHVVAIANVHLTATPYGPELVRDGASAARVLKLERETRLPEIRPYLEPLAALARRGVPVFVVGDMNSPSHLDWTPAVAAVRSQVAYPLEWPVSKALASAGFRDSYRDAHPDPVTRPGLTWTPGTPPPLIRPAETLDRIDWVMASGPAATASSRLVGELGGPDVDVGLERWGSDHRAVASTFDAEPGAAPRLVSASPRVARAGQTLTIRYTTTGGEAGRRIGILPARGRRPLVTLPIEDASDHLAAFFGTGVLPPGAYRAALLDRRGRVQASSAFWVLARGARPRIVAEQRSFAAGEPIRLRWRNAPGNKLDWVGIFRAGPLDVYDYLGFSYLGALPHGRVDFAPGDLYTRLKPGRYLAGLFLDDGYSLLARTSFSVR
jgi:endonuclease/exonuclease/phosphatase family metal-dependent hydrolase